MHIYAFGSLCRGEISKDSDIDLLAIVNDKDERFNSDEYSIYSYVRMRELWSEGNPFAWHLYLESRLVFSDDNVDFLRTMGRPSVYKRYNDDFFKFSSLLKTSLDELLNETDSYVFEMSNIFLSIRNIAICFSLAFMEKPIFSRDAALMIGDKSICLPLDVYSTLKRARIMSTRGIGEYISKSEVSKIKEHSTVINKWVEFMRGRK